MQILDSDVDTLGLKNRSTYNGMIPPLYITKQGAKSETTEEETKKPPQKQVHLKLYKRSARENDAD
jgi:hypothetical protein